MLRNIRRLVFDSTPLWTAFAVFMYALIAVMDGIWLASKTSSPPIIALFSASLPTMTFGARIPVWRLLPVSRLEAGRAQWWLLLGRPIVQVALALGLAVGVVAGFGQLKAGPVEIVALLGAQVTVTAGIGLSTLISAVARIVSGPRTAVVAVIAILIATFGAGLYWMRASALQNDEMMVCGGISLGITLILYGLAGRIPLSQPVTFGAARPPSAPHEGAPNATLPAARARGWAVMAGYFAMRLALMGIAFAALYIAGSAVIPGAGSWLFAIFPLIGLVIGIILQGLQSPRTLAGLPLSPLALTALLQSFGLAGLAISVVAIAIGLAVVGPEAEPLFVPALAADCLFAAGMAALMVPAGLRFGMRIAGVFIGIQSVPLGLLVAMSSSDGTQNGIWMLAAGIVGAVLVLIGWAWTWWELRRGRHAYRIAGIVATRWRGGAG